MAGCLRGASLGNKALTPLLKLALTSSCWLIGSRMKSEKLCAGIALVERTRANVAQPTIISTPPPSKPPERPPLPEWRERRPIVMFVPTLDGKFSMQFSPSYPGSEPAGWPLAARPDAPCTRSVARSKVTPTAGPQSGTRARGFGVATARLASGARSTLRLRPKTLVGVTRLYKLARRNGSQLTPPISMGSA